ncbi:hypothetical protein SISNIDRAFT_467904 [Sistotremastrum niveocremeum HHB9708]|uniref:Uncharacterized protein n=1 Tax=Sistotremastrum niveocremeum HHB9708 TaxID=1314777 RepID=A0A164SC33_9AGAM|nr:hypothetical protein SISNIDRAFT_467904 [Sistotremastrum niveocremeum HHB9708]
MNGTTSEVSSPRCAPLVQSGLWRRVLTPRCSEVEIGQAWANSSTPSDRSPRSMSVSFARMCQPGHRDSSGVISLPAQHILSWLESVPRTLEGQAEFARDLGERIRSMLAECFDDVEALLSAMETGTIALIGPTVKDFVTGRAICPEGEASWVGLTRIRFLYERDDLRRWQRLFESQGWEVVFTGSASARARIEDQAAWTFMRGETYSATRDLTKGEGDHRMLVHLANPVLINSADPVLIFSRCCDQRICTVFFPMNTWDPIPSANLLATDGIHFWHGSEWEGLIDGAVDFQVRTLARDVTLDELVRQARNM